MQKILLALLLLAAVGCGSPKTQTTTPPAFPNLAGSWQGTINLQGYTPNLTIILTEDSSGKLTGTASSSTGCNFSVPVSGAIYRDYTFSVQTADVTLVFAGNLSNNNVDAQGYVNIGSGYSCGPSTGAPFALGKQ